MTDHIPDASKMVSLCPQCSTQVSVAGGSEGTRYYVNADGSEHVCKPLPVESGLSITGGESPPIPIVPVVSADEMPEDSWTELRAGKPALAYIAAYPLLRRIARECGYALALHGSLARDFDLIAVPWTHDAVTPEALVEAICHQSDLRVTVPNKGDRPHGRGSWALQGLTVRNSWVDLSVMPLADDRERLLARVEELERQLRNIEAIGGEALPLYVATYSTVDCPTEDTNASR